MQKKSRFTKKKLKIFFTKTKRVSTLKIIGMFKNFPKMEAVFVEFSKKGMVLFNKIKEFL